MKFNKLGLLNLSDSVKTFILYSLSVIVLIAKYGKNYHRFAEFKTIAHRVISAVC